MEEYHEMMDQYEKDRRDQTLTWICKDAVLFTLKSLKLVNDSQVATMIINTAADLINRLPEHDFCLMDEVQHEQ